MLLDQAWHQTPLAELPADGAGVEEFEAAALERAGVAFPLPRRVFPVGADVGDRTL